MNGAAATRSGDAKARRFRRRIALATMGVLAATLSASPCFAQAAPDLEQLRQELQTLKAEQAKANERIATIERSIDALAGVPSSVPPAATVSAGAPPATTVAAPAPAAAPPSKLQFSGDVRLRYEANTGDADGRDRHRGVLRARLRGSYAINDQLMIGAQLSTGDDDDPNTADVTLTNFDDDLTVSLDQIYARLTLGDLTLTGGKIPLPFKRTDLVWDGDVSPQGLSPAVAVPLGGSASLKASGLYFLIDEAGAAPDSRMIGGQVELSGTSGPVQLGLAGSYYDYRIRALGGGDAGDFRSNLRRPDGRYLSDFNLVDVIASIGFSGLGDRWPVQIVGDFVHNFGAATDADTGFGADIFVGRTSKPHDWRFGYGYSQADVDAVFAAFSHDNLAIATNYRLHTLSIDYVPMPKTSLNLTWYHYQPLDARFAGPDMPGDWLERIRLNFVVGF